MASQEEVTGLYLSYLLLYHYTIGSHHQPSYPSLILGLTHSPPYLFWSLALYRRIIPHPIESLSRISGCVQVLVPRDEHTSPLQRLYLERGCVHACTQEYTRGYTRVYTRVYPSLLDSKCRLVKLLLGYRYLYSRIYISASPTSVSSEHILPPPTYLAL